VKIRVLSSEDLEEYWALKRLSNGLNSQMFPGHEQHVLELGDRAAMEMVWEQLFPGVGLGVKYE
jgi:hypothetical protein